MLGKKFEKIAEKDIIEVLDGLPKDKKIFFKSWSSSFEKYYK